MDFFRLNSFTGSNSSIEEKWNELWWNFKLSIKIDLLIATFIVFAVSFNRNELSALDDKAFFDGDINNGFFYNLAFLIIAATIEEVIFRLHIDFKRNHILISLFASLLFLFLKVYFIWFLVIGNLLILFISSFIRSFNFEKKGVFLSIYILANSLVFALAHVQDFSIINKNNFIVFILVFLIRLIHGILLCRIRLKNHGLQWSIGLHVMLNSIPFIIAFIGSIKNL